MKNVKTDILWRVYLIYMLMLVFGLVIIVKVVYIQLIQGSDLMLKSQKQTLQYFNVEAVRGNICAEDGSLLATSVPIFDLRMDAASPNISSTYFRNHVGELAQKLSGLFGDKSATQYKNNLIRARKEGNRYYLVRRNVDYEQLKKVREYPIFDRGKNKGGLITVPKTIRQKPFGMLAERTIGYVKDTLFVGVEGAFRHSLGGINGKQLMRKINNGDWMPVYDEDAVDPEDGADVITTINLNDQDIAEATLYKHLVENNAEWGCAVIMEVKTGQIKAIANLTRDEETGTYGEDYNYAVGTRIEPGSTFKLPSLIALFEDGLDNLEDTVDIGKGYVVFSGLTIRDIHPIRDGRVSIKEIFEKSSNVGVSTLIYNKYSGDPQKYIDHLYGMSLNLKDGIDIPGEAEPYIKNTKDPSWSKVSLPFMSIGYELKITPLQLLTFYNAVANDGVMVKPMFVKEIREGGRSVEKFDREIINRSICSKSSIKKAHEILEGVVTDGTAEILKNSAYKIAGKTGTAQIASRNKGYNKVNYNASFVGYFPADDPKYSIIIVISNPSSGRYYASSVAVPAFKEIADKVYATNLGIQKNEKSEQESNSIYPAYVAGYQEDFTRIYESLDIPVESSSTKSEWAYVSRPDSTIRFDARIIREGQVPNVRGMGAKDAIYVLENLGLKVIINGRGHVKEQSIPPGSALVKGSQISLRLAV